MNELKLKSEDCWSSSRDRVAYPTKSGLSARWRLLNASCTTGKPKSNNSFSKRSLHRLWLRHQSGLRPEGNDRGLAAGPSGRYRPFPYLGRREALTAGGGN